MWRNPQAFGMTTPSSSLTVSKRHAPREKTRITPKHAIPVAPPKPPTETKSVEANWKSSQPPTFGLDSTSRRVSLTPYAMALLGWDKSNHPELASPITVTTIFFSFFSLFLSSCSFLSPTLLST